ncbi:hypothetical protein AGMMS50256_06080 [Betaproteobacteria bacterium]|nr:hypothetical protein AGMMS50256_06080 [Betaproteobacteria bacterium]
MIAVFLIVTLEVTAKEKHMLINQLACQKTQNTNYAFSGHKKSEIRCQGSGIKTERRVLG